MWFAITLIIIFIGAIIADVLENVVDKSINLDDKIKEAQIKADIEKAQIRYGEPRRQDKLEKRLEELEKTLRNLSPEKLDALRNDINDLKLKVGFR